MEALDAYGGSNPVYLVTGDLAMRIRADTRGLNAKALPQKLMQPLGSDDA